MTDQPMGFYADHSVDRKRPNKCVIAQIANRFIRDWTQAAQSRITCVGLGGFLEKPNFLGTYP